MTTTISRLYPSYSEARDAVRALEAAGLGSGDVSVMVSNAEGRYDEKTNAFPDKDFDGRDDRAEAAGAGAGVGAAAGGTLGALTGLGLMAIPGVGPIVAAGWLVSALAGAVAGAATGGVIGALTQAGISDEEAEVYAEGLRRGGALVSAKVKDEDAARFRSVMDRSSIAIADRAASYRQSGWTRFDPAASPYTAEEARRERGLYS